eukprot:COSAG04_NODE_943_length_9239_cov_3.297155_1_plen_58_part_00
MGDRGGGAGAHVQHTQRHQHMSQPELVIGVVHQKVLEAFWDGPDTFPTRVVVDDVLN